MPSCSATEPYYSINSTHENYLLRISRNSFLQNLPGCRIRYCLVIFVYSVQNTRVGLARRRVLPIPLPSIYFAPLAPFLVFLQRFGMEMMHRHHVICQPFIVKTPNNVSAGIIRFHSTEGPVPDMVGICLPKVFRLGNCLYMPIRRFLAPMME
eukprot:scaffold12918_cov95-Cylindrotheca_fusiformis.AAC.1